MEATSEFVEDRPLPGLDAVSTEYWAGTKRGEFLYQECPACGHRQFYPRFSCTVCTVEPEWKAAAGTGTIHTFTVVRQTYAEPFRAWTPFCVAIIELDEGPRVTGNVVGVDVDTIRIGQRVRVEFVDAAEDCALPFWRVTA